MNIGEMMMIWKGNKPSAHEAMLFGIEISSTIAANQLEMFCHYKLLIAYYKINQHHTHIRTKSIFIK